MTVQLHLMEEKVVRDLISCPLHAKMETALQPMESGLAGLHGQPVTVTA